MSQFEDLNEQESQIVETVQQEENKNKSKEIYKEKKTKSFKIPKKRLKKIKIPQISLDVQNQETPKFSNIISRSVSLNKYSTDLDDLSNKDPSERIIIKAPSERKLTPKKKPKKLFFSLKLSECLQKINPDIYRKYARKLKGFSGECN